MVYGTVITQHIVSKMKSAQWSQEQRGNQVKILSLKGKDDLTKTAIKSYFVNGLADASKGSKKA